MRVQSTVLDSGRLFYNSARPEPWIQMPSTAASIVRLTA